MSGEFPFESMDEIRELAGAIAEPPPPQFRLLAFNQVSATQRELGSALNQVVEHREQLSLAADFINSQQIEIDELKAANKQLLDDMHGLALEYRETFLQQWLRLTRQPKA